MEYYVYENWLHDYVAIHEADCQFCNYGKGPRVKKSAGRFGNWLGPFKSKQEAKSAVQNTKRKIAPNCSRCMKSD